MATNQQVAELLLRYTIDQKALRSALTANAQLTASVNQVGQQQLQLANTAKLVQAELEAVGRSKQFDALALSFARGNMNARQLVTALQTLKATQGEIRGVVREADRMALALQRAAVAGNQPGRLFQGGRLQGGPLGRLGSELRMLPSMPIPGTSFGTDAVANTLRIAGALNSVFTSMGLSMGALLAAGGAVAAGIGALVVVFNAFNAEVEASKRRAEDFSTALAQAFREGTTVAIQELQKQKQAELDAARATRAVLEQRADDARDQLALTMENLSADFRNTMENLASGIFGTDPSLVSRDSSISVEAYNEQIAEQTRIIEAAQIALDAYNLVLGTGENATADATAAEERLAEARRKTALQAAEAARSDVLEVAALFRGTGEQAVSRRDQLQAEARGLEAAIASLQRSGETGEEVSAQLEEYRTQLDGTRADINTITRLLPQIRMAEVLRGTPEAMQKLADAADDFNRETERIRSARVLSSERDQFDFIRSRQRTLADFDRQMAQAEAKQVAREGELRARIAEIDAEANADAVDRTDDFNKEMQRLAEDHQEAIRKINEDAFYAIEDAIAARNSQAAQAAVRERRRAIDEENREYEIEKARREQDFAEEEAARAKQANARRAAAVQALADAQAQYAEERRLREQEFQLRIERENEDRALRMERLAEDQRLEDEARQKALQDKQAAILKDAQLNGTFLNNLGSALTAARNAFVGMVQNAANAISSVKINVPQVNYYNPTTGNPEVTSQGAFGTNNPQVQGVYRNGQYIPRFAEGGIVPANRAMMGYFEGNRPYAEAVIPLRPHILRQIGGGGRGSTTVQFNVGKGAFNVTARDGQDAREVATEVVRQFAEAYTPRLMRVIQEQVTA